jgi:cholest-4-en-3-one 26-monooxygenase
LPGLVAFRYHSPMTPLPDFLDTATFAAGVPHGAYRHLREHAPVSWHESPGDPGYWILVRHQDVQAALVDAATFSSWRGTTVMGEDPPELIDVSRLMLINMDPPQHTRYRRLISRGFSYRVIDRLEPWVRSLTTSILDEILPRGGCDLVADLASRLPVAVIMELLGVPEGDRARLIQYSNDMILHAGQEGALAAAMMMYSYGFQFSAERRAHPGDDLTSRLLSAEIDGERLSDAEFNAFFLLLVVAGNETTRNLISGGMLALIDHPDQLALLHREQGLVGGAVEELLRYVSPVAQFRRTANRDVELHGQRIREGDKVILAHASANRDERVFADPDRLDVRRSPNPHLAFGVGAHLCIGASLARLEARVVLEELLRRADAIELAGPVSRMSSNFINGLHAMPVRFRARGS